MNKVKKLGVALAGAAVIASVGPLGAVPASAATTTPVISSATYVIGQRDAGPYEMVSNETGYSFTPSGSVYTDFQDLTTDPSAAPTKPFASGTIKADSTGRISFSRFIGSGTAHRCHWLRAWAWDYGKSRWVTKDFYASAPGC